MKRTVIYFFFTALLSLFSVTASAYDIAVENEGVTIYYNYSADGKELVVTYKSMSDRGYSGIVVIPDEVTYMNRTRKVTSIGEQAFYSCTGLTSVIIGNSVTTIGNSAFCDCTSLTSVTIGNSVTSIGSYAFQSCSKLKKVIVKDIAAWCNINFGNGYANPINYAHHLYSDENTEITNLIIPNSVTTIGNNAFSGCSGLTSVTIGNSVTTIGGAAFGGCSALTSITIPNSVTSIGGSAFQGCSGLTSITIGNSVTTIGSAVFEGCTRLTSIIIPNSVTSIEGYAFNNCSALTSVTIGNSVTSIGSSAFANCIGLTSITIPNSVTSIGGSAFQGCSGLTSVTIPNSVTSIGRSAFKGCSSLTSVTIPNSVTSIGEQAFKDCTGLTSVTIGNGVTNIGDGVFYACSSLTSITIPNSVTTIGRFSFEGCSSLTSVTIPNSVTSIGIKAFYCENLSTVTSFIETPFAINGKTQSSPTFHLDTFNNATLYVPAGTIEKYKATDGWKDFLFIEEGSGGVTPPPTPQKCATPTIAYNKGTLEFACETEGVEYIGEVNTHKQQQVNAATLTIQEPVTTITVFAKKDGYTNSDTATATISWQNGQPVFEGFSNVTIDSVYDLNGDGKISTADIQVIINEMKK